MTNEERRTEATLELLMAAKEIADKYGLCPVCMVMAAGLGTNQAVIDGEMEHFTDRHFGDEQGTAH